MSDRADFAVILPAAGRGERFGGEKLAQRVAGRSVLEHSIRAFLERSDVSAIVVMRRDPAAPLPVADGIARHPMLKLCAGGEHRAQSVLGGLEAVSALPHPPEFVAIHDAARPAVSQGLIDRVFAAARQHGAAVPGIPVGDTIKRKGDGVVIETLSRAQLVAVQTPQAMRRKWLMEAFDRNPLALAEVTDDAQLLELAGRAVHIVDGEATNLKVTRAGDLEEIERTLGRAPAR